MKKSVLLVIAALAFCISANAQIVSAHYYDIYGSPYFRVDIMKSSGGSYGYYGEESADIHFPTNDDPYHGLGINAAVGYYLPILRTNFFYAPEIGITARLGNTKRSSEDTSFETYSGFGLKVTPLQFGYSFEITSDFTINPRIGLAAAFIPVGSINRNTSNGEGSSNRRDWDNEFETFSAIESIGCDFIMRDKNLILSCFLESGEFAQAGVGLGILF